MIGKNEELIASGVRKFQNTKKNILFLKNHLGLKINLPTY